MDSTGGTGTAWTAGTDAERDIRVVSTDAEVFGPSVAEYAKLSLVVLRRMLMFVTFPEPGEV